MNTTISISVLSIFIFLGIFQGFILSFFFIFRKSPNREANMYQGFLLLALSLCINEQFLNMTGLITRVLPLTNTSEPLNLVIGPLLYLFVNRSIGLSKKYDWVHFVVFALYLLYMFQDYIQTNDFKYNSYVNSFHPDWPNLKVKPLISDDPLLIKKHLNTFTAFQILFYVYLSFSTLARKVRQTGEKLFNTKNEDVRTLRNMVIHILAIILIFIGVKTNFEADMGDYFIGIYVAILTIFTTCRVMNDSSYFDRPASFMDLSIGKYRKSSLNEKRKSEILESILYEFDKRQYYAGNLASLSDLARKTGESQHHVSQVINEKLGQNFFELLASYRIEKAKSILSDRKYSKLTIEEVSELVGYNSKTAFNNAFRKLTGKTPSEFRK